jgi:hypothetical protein
MDAKGVYYGLVQAQNLRRTGDDENEVEDDETPCMMSNKFYDRKKLQKFIFSTSCL